tara:strand:- start:9233 stop:10756 length:1524 start_codon:yes stop_codon:yes gene_type:complete
MAEEKDFMESQDFLGDLFKNVGKSTGASLFEKLSTNARQEALQPLVKSLQIQQFTKPLIELADKAEAAQKAGMAAYIAANPEIDESLLYDGTGDLVNGIMQENNLRFREINRQLSFMDIRNPKYQELANELNKINTTSAQLREDNKKLLGIRNLMKDENRVEELSKGMSSSQQAMYNDILTGNNQNFVNINGKLHWQDPDNADAEPVAISSVDAAGPTYGNSVVMEKHIGLYNEVINAQFVDDAVLHSKVNSLWKSDGVGNAGLKSFIFDNQGADDAMGFDTSGWFTQWYKDNNIVGEEAQLAEYERIRNSGVLADGATDNVKQHFSAWYHSKMKSNVASQYNKKKAAETSTDALLDPPADPNKFEVFVPDNFKYKSKLPALNSNNTYEGQAGTGENFGQTNSPFAGITQYGWSEAGLDSDDAILELGSGDKVVKALTDSYAKYGFKFEESGTFQDKLKLYHNNILIGEVQFDNVAGDKANAKKLQQMMHLAVGLPSTQTITTEAEE